MVDEANLLLGLCDPSHSRRFVLFAFSNRTVGVQPKIVDQRTFPDQRTFLRSSISNLNCVSLITGTHHLFF